MKPLLFAYGTLRRSHRNIHRRLMGGAKRLGGGSIAGTMYDLGAYPGVYRPRGRRSRVWGELYELQDPKVNQRLAVLDRYEGREFRRARVLVELKNGRRHLAWAYLLGDPPPPSARKISSGTYRRRQPSIRAA